MITITTGQAIKIHSQLIAETGGSDGLREFDLLESALLQPFQTFDGEELYPSVIQKAAQLCYSLVENHPFVDGNKRIGVVLMLVFLSLNDIEVKHTQLELIDLGLSIARGNMEPNEIENWIETYVRE